MQKKEREKQLKRKLTLQEINKTDKALINKIRKRGHKLSISGRREVTWQILLVLKEKQRNIMNNFMPRNATKPAETYKFLE